MKSDSIPATLCALCCLCALPLSASARTLAAIYFRGPGNAPAKIYANSSGATLVLPLPKMNLSDRTTIPEGDLVLRLTLEPPAKDQSIPAGAPSVTIPAAWTDVILLFAHNPKDAAFPFVATALDVSLTKFKPGEMLVFNRTNTTIGGKLGTRSMRVGPGLSVKVDPPADTTGDYPVAIGYLPAGEQDARPLAYTTWRHETEVRQLLFILPDVTRGVPRVWSVPLRLQEPQTPNP